MDTCSLRQRVEDSHLHRGCQRTRASGSGSPLGKEVPTSISEGKNRPVENVSLSAFSPSCRSWIITASWTRPLRPKKPRACRSSLCFCVAAVNWAGWFHHPQAIPDLQQLLICKSRPESIYIYRYFFVEASVCHTIMSQYVLTLRSKR